MTPIAPSSSRTTAATTWHSFGWFLRSLGCLLLFLDWSSVLWNGYRSDSGSGGDIGGGHRHANNYALFVGPMVVHALNSQSSNSRPQSSKPAMRVLVTGAAGKTGRLVLSKLEQDPRYEPKGLVRNEQSAKRIVQNKEIKCPLEHVVIADITSPTFLQDLQPSVGHHGLDKLEAMIICTSAVPRISKRSLVKVTCMVPLRWIQGKKPLVDFKSLRFEWKHPPHGYPEKVDYEGQINQIELAKQLGIPHVVVVSSMGGTDPNNFLNSVGKSQDGTGHGDILYWKRQAEKYLVESGLDYTIIHPGGLVDTPGGKEEFLLDVDDKLYQGPKRSTRISREDLADLCIAALSVGKGQKVSFDCITREISEDDSVVRARPQTAEDALSKFLELSKTTNYAL